MHSFAQHCKPYFLPKQKYHICSRKKALRFMGIFPQHYGSFLKKIAFFFDKTQAVGYKVSIEYRERERV